MRHRPGPTHSGARRARPSAGRSGSIPTSVSSSNRRGPWLLGPPEDGYGPELERLVAAAHCPVLQGVPDMTDGSGPGGAMHVDDAYLACDVVALPSTWEGFGNPSLESVTHRRPLVIGPYPVAAELASFGFEWFPLDAMAKLDAWLAAPDPDVLERNLEVARTHFSLDDLADRIASILPPC
jgi:mannosylglucosylglycerate synthase